MPFEDLKHIRSLRRSQAALFENITRAAEAKRVVIYSMDPWQLGVVDQFLHLAFQRRGHAPVSIYYDGLLPLTAWENAATPPPTVDSLKQRAEAIYEAFGIAPRGISRYVDKTAVTESARTLIDSADDAALPHLTHRGIPVGEIALRDLFQYTLGHFEPTTPDDFALYRRT